jgi:epoxyqueuosine reductase
LKSDTTTYSQYIRDQALGLGFSFVGFAKAGPLPEEAGNLQIWLSRGYHGEMAYMASNIDKRVDPTQLVPGAKSVIVLMHNYFAHHQQCDAEAPKVARYARGDDYHEVLKGKMTKLLEAIKLKAGDVQGRCFVDSAPILERDWARKAGLGWAGKNTLLIHPRAGSYYFLAVMIVDIELDPGQPIEDHCGTCRRCIEACPTNAILPSGYVLDASKCISYLTIEHRSPIPEQFKPNMQNWVFGCDICQEVCPWNRFSKPNEEPAFQPRAELLNLSKRDWQELTLESYYRVFRKSAVKRTKFEGLKRNIRFLENQATGKFE